MKRRLGIVIGEGAIGWCLIEAQSRIVDLGVRVFDTGRNPRTGASWAVDRRLARIARRRRDRYVRRRTAFLAALTEFGLMPRDPAEAAALARLDPYILRDRGLNEPLTPYEFGRALFHLNQRRGFKRNRRAAPHAAEPDGLIASAGQALDAAMQASGARTLGEYLASREVRRSRRGDDGYPFFAQRAHIADEFDRLWAAQLRFHPDRLTPAAAARLRGILLHQRPLHREPARRCAHVPADTVLAKAHPLYRQIALWARINALRLVDGAGRTMQLTPSQRAHAVRYLSNRARCSPASLLRDMPDLPPGTRLAGDPRAFVTGDAVSALLSGRAAFGPQWLTLPQARQAEILDRLLEEEDPDALHAFLIESCGLDEDRAVALAQARLPRGEALFGEIAARLILAQLKDDVIDLDAAVERGGLASPTGVYDRLPYYGEVLAPHLRPVSGACDPAEARHGRIAHPAMHVAWRQLQKLVNAIIDRHGRPDRITLELGRVLKQTRVDAERQRSRVAQGKALARALCAAGVADTGRNRAVLGLWARLPGGADDRRACIYCGAPIAFAAIFSDAVAIDRIVPFSRATDDSAANRLLVHAGCRLAKGSRTPFEAWGGDPARWPGIAARAVLLEPDQHRRFAPDAAPPASTRHPRYWDAQADRHRLARLSVRYLQSLYPPSEPNAVRAVSGRMTRLLAAIWRVDRLRSEARGEGARHAIQLSAGRDHRELAVAAGVVAQLSHRAFQAMSRAARRAECRDTEQLLVRMPPPWPGFSAALGQRVAALVTSHRAEHAPRRGQAARNGSTAGRLHNETAYALTGRLAADRKTPIVAHRIPLDRLTAADIARPGRIADPALQRALQDVARGRDGATLQAALRDVAERLGPFRGIRRVRVREPLNVVPIHDASGRAFKAYKPDTNARWELWRLPDDALVTRVVTLFDAHRIDGDDRPHPAASLRVQLCKNDLVALDGAEGGREIFRVVGFSRDGRLTLAGANEAGNLKARDRSDATLDPFSYLHLTGKRLAEAGGRQVRVDLLGQMFDPGPSCQVGSTAASERRRDEFTPRNG